MLAASHRLWIAIGAGGAAGALVRYALSGWVVRRIPAGTLAVNVGGCLAIGLLMALAVRTRWISPLFFAFWVTGFLGALTTFSTFGYQTMELLRRGDTQAAFWNVALNLGAGLAAVWLGLVCGEWIAARYTPPMQELH